MCGLLFGTFSVMLLYLSFSDIMVFLCVIAEKRLKRGLISNNFCRVCFCGSIDRERLEKFAV